MEKLNLLVVEDNTKHISDLKIVLEHELPKWPIQVNVTWATNYIDAVMKLDDADAVLSDVFFPMSEGGKEEQGGTWFCKLCKKDNKPVVLVTSTHHHGKNTQPVHVWCMQNDVEMFDCFIGTKDGIATEKPWRVALYGLVCLVTSRTLVELPKYFSLFESTHSYLRGEDTDPVVKKMIDIGFPKFSKVLPALPTQPGCD